MSASAVNRKPKCCFGNNPMTRISRILAKHKKEANLMIAEYEEMRVLRMKFDELLRAGDKKYKEVVGLLGKEREKIQELKIMDDRESRGPLFGWLFEKLVETRVKRDQVLGEYFAMEKEDGEWVEEIEEMCREAGQGKRKEKKKSKKRKGKKTGEKMEKSAVSTE